MCKHPESRGNRQSDGFTFVLASFPKIEVASAENRLVIRQKSLTSLSLIIWGCATTPSFPWFDLDYRLTRLPSEKKYGTSVEIESYVIGRRIARHRLATAFLARRSDVETQAPAAASVGRVTKRSGGGDN
ncbi:hypothetical protein EVAR_34103_1 [Eumeta japonica]|uniref:Uncharacterized protein n=1 Tax=Eumeta variegata TaxID=151549 RepID=A0A4C1WMG9_EUMVA|nr:hypothetical protein EVAR_34103_1 [Eumeta japonica]